MKQRIFPDDTLRPMIRADLELVLEWRNHPDIRRVMYNRHEIKLAEHLTWFARVENDPREHQLILEINQIPQGFVQFHQSANGRIAEWGFYIAPDAPKGTGQRLGRAGLDHAFTAMKQHKVCGEALVYNKESIRFHLGLGFHQEGVLRDHHFDGQKYYDVLCFGLLASEWQPLC